jgi:hypothetical protein
MNNIFYTVGCIKQLVIIRHHNPIFLLATIDSLYYRSILEWLPSRLAYWDKRSLWSISDASRLYRFRLQ